MELDWETSCGRNRTLLAALDLSDKLPSPGNRGKQSCTPLAAAVAKQAGERQLKPLKYAGGIGSHVKPKFLVTR